MTHLLLCLSALAGPVQDFESWSGVTLNFETEHLPEGRWYEIIVPLDPDERDGGGAIALEQARHFPAGSLGAAGLRTSSIFAAVETSRDDGYHAWDEALGGYAYYGMYDGRGNTLAAWYTDGQLPLTLQHEWFHHLDQVTGLDNERYALALDGTAPYAPPEISPADLRALRTLSGGAVLRDTVSAYASKSADEDQAETARWLHSHLPDALVQVHERPELPGSQRLLHVISVTEEATGADCDWLVDVALGRVAEPVVVAGSHPVIRPEVQWAIRGYEDEEGINWTLRRDVARVGAEPGAGDDPQRTLETIALLADYHEWIDAHWSVTPGTRQAFEAAIADALDALPPQWGVVSSAVEASSLEALAEAMDPTQPVDGSLVSTLAVTEEVNLYLDLVDEDLSGPWAKAVRRTQPAMVRVRTGGGSASGVVISADGLVLTAAHVPDRVGRVVQVQLPEGSTWAARCTRLDPEWDLALLQIREPVVLPWVELAPDAPEVVQDVAIVGQPGSTTPGGEPTGYQPFYVSSGEIRFFASDRLANQSLGGTAHDAWTYWGHSGSPLLDRQGRIVALHNSWDSSTAMRHAITWEALHAFLEEE